MAKTKANTSVYGIVRRVQLVDFKESSKLAFDIPVSSSYKDKNGEWKKTPTEWYSFVLWGKKDDYAFKSAVTSITEGVYVSVFESERMTETYTSKTGEQKSKVVYKVGSYFVSNGGSAKDGGNSEPVSAGNDDVPF